MDKQEVELFYHYDNDLNEPYVSLTMEDFQTIIYLAIINDKQFFLDLAQHIEPDQYH